MEILLLNTTQGLKPCEDEDYEKKKKLKIGEIYRARISKERNYDFHKKYFALIKLAWEYQNERTNDFFKSDIDLFRKTIEISAGHCELVYSIERKEWIEIPKSISFNKMDEHEFQDLYERVKDVIFRIFLKNVSAEEFMNNLINF